MTAVFGIAPAAETEAFAAAHPGLDTKTNGRPHLAVRDGLPDTTSLHISDVAHAATPQWDDLETIS